MKLGLTRYYEGNLNQAEIYWQEGLDLSLANSNTYYIIAMLNCMARLTNQKGELKRSEMFFQQAFDLLEEHPGQYLIWLGAMQRDYSDLLRDLNRLEEACALIVTAIPTARKMAYDQRFRIWVFLGCQDPVCIQAICRRRMKCSIKSMTFAGNITLYPDLETLALVTRARLYLEEGQTGQAWQILEDLPEFRLRPVCLSPRMGVDRSGQDIGPHRSPGRSAYLTRRLAGER